jgi:hypothetical protein
LYRIDNKRIVFNIFLGLNNIFFYFNNIFFCLNNISQRSHISFFLDNIQKVFLFFNNMYIILYILMDISDQLDNNHNMFFFYHNMDTLLYILMDISCLLDNNHNMFFFTLWIIFKYSNFFYSDININYIIYNTLNILNIFFI